MISCIVFDFDGTLVLSNEIKRETFYAVADRFESGRSSIEQILREQPGDRVEILSRFAEAMGVPERMLELVDSYTRLCHDGILRCPHRAGATEMLSALKDAGYRMYVNSSTPAIPLQSLVDERFRGIFDGVFGGHGRKLANLRAIATAEHLQPETIMMVGDGLDDRAAAAAFGCEFVGVSGGTLPETVRPSHVVQDLRDILPLFLKTENRAL